MASQGSPVRLVTYAWEGGWRPGISVRGQVVDAAQAAAVAGVETSEPLRSNRMVLVQDRLVQRRLAEAAEYLAASDGRPAKTVGSTKDVRLGPPIADPEKIICLGLNYRAHAEETGLSAESFPTLFGKFANSLIGSGEPIVLPRASDEVDYEGELAIVIGQHAADVDERDALDCVAGCMPFNDVSARDLQMLTSQWMAGKALDGFAPCGPELVLVDELGDLEDLELMTRVNGEVLQHDRTSRMIFGIARTISIVSGLMTLKPGDIIATGTPEGVGYTREPPRFLDDGDVVEVEISGVGLLSNEVVSRERAQQDTERGTQWTTHR